MFFALLLRVFFLNVYHVSNTNKVSLYHTQSAAEWEVCAPRLKFKLLREERRKERERREERERERGSVGVDAMTVVGNSTDIWRCICDKNVVF